MSNSIYSIIATINTKVIAYFSDTSKLHFLEYLRTIFNFVFNFYQESRIIYNELTKFAKINEIEKHSRGHI